MTNALDFDHRLDGAAQDVASILEDTRHLATRVRDRDELKTAVVLDGLVDRLDHVAYELADLSELTLFLRTGG